MVQRSAAADALPSYPSPCSVALSISAVGASGGAPFTSRDAARLTAAAASTHVA
jgi:hypothetical protein